MTRFYNVSHKKNNLSETAYFTKENETTFNLRWFTPEYEIDLCGHATLATAHVIFSELNYKRNTVNFKTWVTHPSLGIIFF